MAANLCSDRLGASDPGTATPFRAMAVRRGPPPAVLAVGGKGSRRSLSPPKISAAPMQPASKPPETTVADARAKSKMPPVHKRQESCKTFLERARKRVIRAQEVIDRALELKAIFETEVAEGERRLELLQAEAANPHHQW